MIEGEVGVNHWKKENCSPPQLREGWICPWAVMIHSPAQGSIETAQLEANNR